MSGPIVILGPQRPDPNLTAALDAHGIDGPVAVLTAGWRHDEGETSHLVDACARPVRHLRLYDWYEEFGLERPDLALAYKEQQGKIKRLKDLYRVRLHAALNTVYALSERTKDDPDLLEPEIERAIEAVRRIDAEMLERSEALRGGFPERPWEDEAVRPKFDELREQLAGCAALLIAGGHVGVLRNRMFFYGFSELLPETLARGAAVFAWSAGAMTLTDRVVLFYDDPPEGQGESEVFSRGFGLLPGLVVFPHARRRLRLTDPRRVSLNARRFGGDCIGMENGSWLLRSPQGWTNRGAPGTAVRFEISGEATTLPGAEG